MVTEARTQQHRHGLVDFCFVIPCPVMKTRAKGFKSYMHSVHVKHRIQIPHAKINYTENTERKANVTKCSFITTYYLVKPAVM